MFVTGVQTCALRSNTGVGCHFLLQGIFPSQGSNLGLLHCRQILYHLSQTTGVSSALAFPLDTPVFLGFPCGSAGKESACNVGDLGLIPGMGKSPGEGKGYHLSPFSPPDRDRRGDSPAWSALVTVKRLPTMQETWVQSMGREDPLEKEMATHSSILAWKIPWTEEPGGLPSMGRW